MATRMQQRKGTAAQWISTNSGNGPVLNAGEIGYETDTNKFKIGDGINHWVDLNYFLDAVALGGSIDDYIPLTQRGVANGVATLNADGVIPSSQIPSLVGLDSEITTAVTDAINNLVDGAPGALNTLNELAAAVNDDSSYASTVTTALGLKAPINNPAFTGNVSGITQSMVGLGNVNNTSDADKPVSNAMQDALDEKANLQSPTFTGTVSGITKSMVGLGNVDNTSDANKPVSTATANALDLKMSISEADGAAVSAVYNKLNGGDGIDITQNPTTNQITVAIDSTVATESYADSAASGAVSAHEADTTNVHGITDTANLVTLAGTQELTNKTITDPTIKIGSATVSSAELGYLDGLTTNVNTKFGDIDTALGTKVNSADLTALAQDAVGGSIGTGLTYDTNTNVLSVDQTAMKARVANISDTEIGYLDGVTSAIQTQINNANTSIDAKLPKSGGTMTGAIAMGSNKITGLGTPTADADAATKLYVDNVVSNINFHEPVRVATTANITLSGTQTIDGVSVIAGDRVLVKDQTDQKTNGIYVVDSSTWSRSADADNTPDGELKGGDFTLVLEGTVGSGFGYVCSNTSAITIGTTNITYAPFSAGKTVSAGNGLQEATPGTLSIDTSITQTRVSGVSDTEIGYLDGVTSAIQTQIDNKLASLVTIDPETASYTLVLANRDQMVEMNVGSGNTLTVPANSSVAFPVGTKIHVVQTGTGQTTLTPAGGVTINGTPGLKLRAQWSAVTLIKRATDTWIAFGDLTA